MARELKLHIDPRMHPSAWDPEKALADALAERALFLKNNPRHKPFQQDIDRLMEKAGNPENRMTVIAVLMEAKLIELHDQLKHLNTILIRATDGRFPQTGIAGPHPVNTTK